MQAGFLKNAIILGLLSAIGPFAIDMYLPALPTIGTDLRASEFAVKMSLFIFFVSMGLGQLIVGPLSDIYGRKKPLYFGLALFAIGSVGSAMAPSIQVLIAFRFLQGLGASAGVIPRAVVRDMHTGVEAAKLMSLLMLVFSVSPILAPLTGSVIIKAAGWRWVFWAVLIASAIGGLLAAFGLRETRSQEEREKSSIASSMRGYRLLLRDRNFLGLVLIGGFGISSFFVYLSNSPFVLMKHYGLSEAMYSVYFSMNALAFFAVSQFTGVLTARFGLHRVVRVAVSGFAAVMATLLVLNLVGMESLALLATLLFVGFGFLGLVIPTTSVLAMEEHGEIAGTASALMGAIHFTVGILAMVFSSLFANGTQIPMVAGIALCAGIAFGISRGVLGRHSERVRLEEGPVAVESIQG
ncbi:Bcr/CflA family efflux MFS transporter [bacterium]|nr:MAG: Bcr/CflA family efflux MFS transporter [bacterium]